MSDDNYRVAMEAAWVDMEASKGNRRVTVVKHFCMWHLVARATVSVL